MGFVLSKSQKSVKSPVMKSPRRQNRPEVIDYVQTGCREAEKLHLKTEEIVPNSPRNGGMAFYVPTESSRRYESRRLPRVLKRLEKRTNPEFSVEEKIIMADILHQDKLEEKRKLSEKACPIDSISLPDWREIFRIIIFKFVVQVIFMSVQLFMNTKDKFKK